MEAVTAPRLAFAIGGIEFALASDGLPILQELHWPYLPFLGGGAASGAAEPVRVRLEVDDAAAFEGETIFSSEATWSILARGGERAFVFREPGSPAPLFVARFRPGSREVSIACSSRLVRDGGAGPALASPFRYPLDQVLTMYLLGDEGFVVHAAGLAFEGRGVAFPGVSGAGKSTIARLLAGRAGWAPLSDDRVILTRGEGGPALHGSPWPGEGKVAENRKVPAALLLFLEKGSDNRVTPITPAQALARLFPVVSIPWFDAEVLPGRLAACEAAVASVPAAVLEFRPDAGAAEAVEAYL